jgi:hypothetical protein
MLAVSAAVPADRSLEDGGHTMATPKKEPIPKTGTGTASSTRTMDRVGRTIPAKPAAPLAGKGKAAPKKAVRPPAAGMKPAARGGAKGK